MDKRTELNSALKEALKAKDQVALGTIRLIMAALKDRDIDARGKGNADGVGDNEILSLLQSMVKQRQESTDIYRKADRVDLAKREEAEIAVIKRFLPEQMDADETKKVVTELVEELGVADIKGMGKVMAELKTRYAGKLDMSGASAVVREILG